MERFIVFSNNGQNFAINISHVDKIIEYQKPSVIPESSKFLIGVIQYDDEILPIINMNQKLYGVESTYDENNQIIVVIWKDKSLGLAVDTVIGIKGFEDKLIEKSPLDTSIAKEYVVGFIKGEELIIVLDTDTIFNFEQGNEIIDSVENLEQNFEENIGDN